MGYRSEKSLLTSSEFNLYEILYLVILLNVLMFIQFI